MSQAELLKEEGNQLFKKQQYQEAIQSYTQAIAATQEQPTVALASYSNRAACHLKLSQYQLTVDDCTSALAIEPMFEKALYRRALAYEKMDQLPLAFQDLKQLLAANPKNQPAIVLARSVREAIQKRNALSDKVNITKRLDQLQRLQYPQDEATFRSICNDLAANCARSELIANDLIESNGVSILWQTVLTASSADTDEDERYLAVCVLDSVASHGAKQTTGVFQSLSIEKQALLQKLISFPNQKVSQASIRLVFSLVTHAYFPQHEQHESTIHTFFKALFDRLMDASCASAVQVLVLDGFIRLIESFPMTQLFVQADGLNAIYELAAKNDAQITARLPLLLNQLFSQYPEKEAESQVKAHLQTYCLDRLQASGITNRKKAIGLLGALFLINREAALWTAQQPGCMSALHQLIKLPDDENAQALAVDVLAQIAAMEQGKALFTKPLFTDLSQMMHSTSLRVRASAVTTTVKLAAVSKSYHGESVPGKIVLEAVLAILEQYDEEVGKAESPYAATAVPKERAIEALSYLIHDTSVKETIAQHPLALKVLTATSSDKEEGHYEEKTTVAYGIAYILCHVMASEEELKKLKMQDMEMTYEQYQELQKALKQKTEEEEAEKDHPQKVCSRIRKVVDAGGLRILCRLCQMSPSNSFRIQSTAVQALLQATQERSVHGLMIQQGAIRALVPLTTIHEPAKQTKDTKQLVAEASQILAKLLITTNPQSIQSSQLFSAIQPLMTLLDSDRDLLHFEALMALTNIATTGDDAKTRILANKGLKKIQYVQFSDHELVRRAATELICNLMPHPEILDLLQVPEKLKLFLAFARQEDDPKLASAAAGVLAMASDYPKVAQGMVNGKALDTLEELICGENKELQHRAVYALENLVQLEDARGMIKANEKFCKRLEELKVLKESNVSSSITSILKTLQL